MTDLVAQLAAARAARDKLAARINTKRARDTLSRAAMSRLYNRLLAIEAEIRDLRNALTNTRTRTVVYRKAPSDGA